MNETNKGKKNAKEEVIGTATEAVYDSGVEKVPYSDDELEQISAIVTRLVRAKQDRDTIHPEFNEKNFVEQYQENERIANTYVKGKKFDGDVEIASGTVEQKMFAVLSEINRLSLSPEVICYDENNEELVSLGRALTDVILETQDMDDDQEGKILRQLELLKQGTVFVEERWCKEYKMTKKFDKKSIGKVKGLEWQGKLEKVFEGPRRKVLFAPGVYLGNIRTCGPMREQPFIFTHKLVSYEDVQSRYGMKDGNGECVWERFKYVSKSRISGLNSETITTAGATGDDSNVRMSPDTVNQAWGLSDVKEGMVEEVYYQDRFNDEFQIFLNGTAMLPVGFPLSAISANGEYTIEKQILQLINPFFAYGRSFSMKVREQSDILDELLRLLVIKTRKSIHPPYANVGHRVISSKVLMPGRITMGIDANVLQPIGVESQGATASEFQMFKLLQDRVDENTVSKQFTGMQGKSGTTAFEVATLQKQAEKLLSLTIFACTMMEMKVGYQRLFNVLDNYFDPIDTRVDDMRQAITNRYRTTSRSTSLGGDLGEGVRQVIPTDDLPTPGAVYSQERTSGAREGMTREKAGLPKLRRIYLDPKMLKKARLMWYIDIDTQPKETSNAKKLLFREELADIMALINLGSRPNIQELEKQHAVVWNRQKDKLFGTGKPEISPEQLQQARSEGGGIRKPSLPGGPGTAAAPNESALSVAGVE
jgi:hypothetical protein